MMPVKKRIRYFKYMSCIKKLQYDKLSHAEEALIRLELDGLKSLNVYKCVFHEHYHIGHTSKKIRYRVKQIFKMIGEVDGN